MVSVPDALLELAIELARAVDQESATQSERDSILVGPTASATARQGLYRARKFFTPWFHVDRQRRDVAVRSVPSDGEIVGHIEAFEAVLSSRLAGFFESRSLLDALLRDINSTGEAR